MTKELLIIIGTNIKNVRTEKGIKGDTLGKPLNKTKAWVSQVESGLVDIKISTLVKISEILGVTVNQLVCSNTFHSLRQYQKVAEPEHLVLMNSAVIDRLLNKIEKLNRAIEQLSKTSPSLKSV